RGFVGERARRSELRLARAARRAARDRAGDRAEDSRLPPGARRIPLARGARRGAGHRPGADRAAERAGGAAVRRPYLLAGALAVGLAAATVVRASAVPAAVL